MYSGNIIIRLGSLHYTHPLIFPNTHLATQILDDGTSNTIIYDEFYFVVNYLQ